jgi:predicted nucleotidyltransferase
LPIPESTILEAVRLLNEAAPGADVVLFGSFARGEQAEHSDLDFLVIEPEVRSRRDEIIRLRLTLRPLRVPVDILVVSASAFSDLARIPGTVYYWAHKHGRRFDVSA